jgi:tRNA (cmo5U34)-methyltransferase
MLNNTQAVFDATASTYDRDRSRLIPGCDRFYSRAIELIPANAKSIVDLGAGSGLLTILLRQHCPAAHIHLIDFSAPMLALAKQRLGDDPNLTFEQADYTSAPLPQQQCAIVSSLSIHHLDDVDKRIFYSRCHDALKPNGVFVNADHIAGPTPELETLYQQRWLAEIRALGASEQQISESLYRNREDRRSPIEAQLQWLREAGFADADCWFKESSFAVLTGTHS